VVNSQNTEGHKINILQSIYSTNKALK